MNVAIIRFSALGDIILSAVFLPFIREHYPQVRIHWFVDTIFAPILLHSPYIDHLHIIPYKQTLHTKNPLQIWNFYRNLKQHTEDFDVLIDMQGLLKSALFGACVRKKAFVGFDISSIKERLASLFYSHKVTIPYSTHILKRNQAILEHGFNMLNTCIWDHALEMRHSAFYLPSCPQLHSLFKGTRPKILFVLEASTPNKMYPWQHFAQVGRLLQNKDVEIVILWHAHFKHAQALYDALKSRMPTILLPPLKLEEIKTLVSLVHVVVGGDTGIVHLAWALQIPSVTLYGNTPKTRFALEGYAQIALVGNAHANYSKRDFSIQRISPQQVAQAIIQLIEKKS
ncbi:lipopolysaccharide heptosyltransferase I [Helicobacter baculiformis]|uniref:Lipopolysaccharide heptosyltransferase 1 n=1 Tax=Helicobacter baculiformis TaxID=427351 RepID=A0ABV7ZJ91_9HELI|nr:lipopolysaccharide heptosyltransferase I [Helicobacter baculiformis]